MARLLGVQLHLRPVDLAAALVARLLRPVDEATPRGAVVLVLGCTPLPCLSTTASAVVGDARSGYVVEIDGIGLVMASLVFEMTTEKENRDGR